MNWVADGIAIGGLADAVDHSRLLNEGVDAVLQLYAGEREKAPFPIPVEVLHLQARDRQSMPTDRPRESVAFIRAHQEQGRRVLVCCGAGISRSTTFVAAYLHEQGVELAEALSSIRAHRPQCRPHREMLRSLIEYYGLDTAPETLLRDGSR